ncbi:MAG: hypothetical protein J6R42_05255 [Clostridia bacterium]|nr:hypothetical protein [Clostridia bacterium]
MPHFSTAMHATGFFAVQNSENEHKYTKAHSLPRLHNIGVTDPRKNQLLLFRLPFKKAKKTASPKVQL